MSNWPELIFYLTILIGGVSLLLHVAFAIAVYVDSERLVNDDKVETALVPGPIWAIATLFGGVLVAIGYWVANRSKIANRKEGHKDFDITDYLS